MFEKHQLKRVTSVEDLRFLAEQRVPQAFFQYADQGSYEQSTLRATAAISRRSNCASASGSTLTSEAYGPRSPARRSNNRNCFAPRVDSHDPDDFIL
jgi:hypothetical protein